MEQYIAETLDSILCSTYENIEVIVIDDGSTDTTVSIVEKFMARDNRIRLFKQNNAGPSCARNNGIRNSHGEYILPIDSDDLISPSFIDSAVNAIQSDNDIKVVSCRCEFFGLRKGEWILPDFNLNKLALDNRICATSMYRRSDWERIGGYNETIIAREDWAFWIAMLKDGGKVYKLPEIGFYYRVRAASKRFQDRKLKGFVIKRLNRMFPDFFERELGGQLYVQRTHSAKINSILRWLRPQDIILDKSWADCLFFVKALPRIINYAKEEKTPIKLANRNVQVQEFGLSLGSYKSSPARKAYLKAIENKEKIIGYYAERRFLFFNKSFLIK
ncbi:MAG: glycosyltransferase [Bacteroides sp.]|nr:glycosyltransferase [Bacteroides sp.]